LRYLWHPPCTINCDIDSISLNPNTVLKATQEIVETELQRLRQNEAAA